ncbi:60S ribosomal protein L15, partial [Galemys pyrenaicus]
VSQMSTYKYIQEWWRKKQSMRHAFSSGDPAGSKAAVRPPQGTLSPAPTDKCRLGTLQGQARGHKCPVPRGAIYGSLSIKYEATEVARRLQSATEGQTGCPCGALRRLNSYRVAEDSTHKLFEMVLINLFHKAIRS